MKERGEGKWSKQQSCISIASTFIIQISCQIVGKAINSWLFVTLNVTLEGRTTRSESEGVIQLL